MRVSLSVGVLMAVAVVGAAWYLSEPSQGTAGPGWIADASAQDDAPLVHDHGVAEPGPATEPFRDPDRAERSTLAEEALLERRFLVQRRRLAKQISELLEEKDVDAVERRISTYSQLRHARKAFEIASSRKFDAERLAVPVAGKIAAERYATDRFERVSLVGMEVEHPGCNGAQAYKITAPQAEFREQFVLYSTTALKGQEPQMRIVRINPGESREFDEVNRRRLELLDDARVDLRRDLAKLEELTDEEDGK